MVKIKLRIDSRNKKKNPIHFDNVRESIQSISLIIFCHSSSYFNTICVKFRQGLRFLLTQPQKTTAAPALTRNGKLLICLWIYLVIFLTDEEQVVKNVNSKSIEHNFFLAVRSYAFYMRYIFMIY